MMASESKVEIRISRNAIALVIAGIISLLFVAHLCGWLWVDVLGNDTGHELKKRIDLNAEASIPTWFSSSMLLASAFLLVLIGICKRKMKARHATHWILLALIFVFLSCDETAQIHEWTVGHVYELTGNETTRFIGWVIPYSILLVVFAIAYIPFFLHLPNRFKVLLAGAGCIYVGGALGMEILTVVVGWGLLEGKFHFFFEIFEELFEMGGVALFIYALLSYLSWYINDVLIHFKAKKNS